MSEPLTLSPVFREIIDTIPAFVWCAAPDCSISRSGASTYARTMTMGSSATQGTSAIFHFGGGCIGAGRSGSVNQVSKPDRIWDNPSAVLTTSASRNNAWYGAWLFSRTSQQHTQRRRESTRPESA